MTYFNGMKIVKLSLCGVVLLGMQACATAPSSEAEQMPNKAKADIYTQELFELSASADQAYRSMQWDTAEQQYKLLAQQIPTDGYVLFRLANVFVKQGDIESAITAYKRSLNYDSKQAKPWFNLSTAYLFSAKNALEKAYAELRDSDPAKEMIGYRITQLTVLLSNSGVGTDVNMKPKY